MTIESTTTSVTLLGDDATTEFSLSPLKVYSSDDITVKTLIGGVYTEVSEGVGSTNYSLSLPSTPGVGTLTYPADEVTPLATGENLVVYIEPKGTQEIDLQNQTAYNAEVVEKLGDLTALMALSLLSKYERSFKVPEGETTVDLPSSTDRANKYLGFDGNGNATASSLVSTGVLSVSAFVETLLNDATASDFLDTLGFSSDAKTLVGNTVAQIKTQLGLGTAADVDTGTTEGDVVLCEAGDTLPVSVMPTAVLNSEITGTVSFDEVELWDENDTPYGSGDSTITVAHGLGAAPDMIPMCRFTCIVEDNSYGVGDTVYMSPAASPLDNSPDGRGFQLDWDATNIYYIGPRDPIVMNIRATNGDTQSMAALKWQCEALCLTF